MAKGYRTKGQTDIFKIFVIGFNIQYGIDIIIKMAQLHVQYITTQ